MTNKGFGFYDKNQNGIFPSNYIKKDTNSLWVPKSIGVPTQYFHVVQRGRDLASADKTLISTKLSSTEGFNLFELETTEEIRDGNAPELRLKGSKLRIAAWTV